MDHGLAVSQQPEEVKVSSSYSLAGQVGLADRTGEQLQLPASQVDRADVTLAGLTDCRVEIAGCPSTLHISNIKLVSLEPMLNSKINVIFELVTKVEKLPTDIALERVKLEAKQTF